MSSPLLSPRLASSPLLPGESSKEFSGSPSCRTNALLSACICHTHLCRKRAVQIIALVLSSSSDCLNALPFVALCVPGNVIYVGRGGNSHITLDLASKLMTSTSRDTHWSNTCSVRISAILDNVNMAAKLFLEPQELRRLHRKLAF